jgi:hypothetical protein
MVCRQGNRAASRAALSPARLGRCGLLGAGGINSLHATGGALTRWDSRMTNALRMLLVSMST